MSKTSKPGDEGNSSGKKKTMNQLTGKMEMLSKTELKVINLIVKAKAGDTKAFNTIMNMIDKQDPE